MALCQVTEFPAHVIGSKIRIRLGLAPVAAAAKNGLDKFGPDEPPKRMATR